MCMSMANIVPRVVFNAQNVHVWVYAFETNACSICVHTHTPHHKQNDIIFPIDLLRIAGGAPCQCRASQTDGEAVISRLLQCK